MLLNYKQIGTGEDVILIHGLFGSLENLNVIAKPLSEHYKVTNVDLRNHGGSFHSPQMNYEAMADDICSLMDSLGIKKAHIIGHSMGGKVAMQLALTHSDKINKLVVLDIAPVEYPARHTKIIHALKHVQEKQVNDRKQADLLMQPFIEELGVRQFLLKSLTKNENNEYHWRFNLAVLDEKYRTITANVNENNSCLCDTLFIKGNDSDYILPEHKDAIISRFKNTSVKIIHGAGHWLHAQKPQAVNKIIQDFLN
ncbi:alpha/beta fold hydrolase [Pseudoalteromonas sp. MMG010]|uniref:alpha/beta fold hydrolase n=1 Tax=Pseudoalteromonas sp. MMG010 TaxID=2822685 RepID=UPI001B3A6BF9|nr:alpha/beta fold hydrolase [Pseudoalteromonas sp. MMG010]MBQ4832358.1 alpha/beta fold hydrolase [Pseudoalteromonas sp. MMG010]